MRRVPVREEPMRCPICKKSVLRQGNPYRPFCSERCKLIDLDNWLSERYGISTPIEIVEKPAEAVKSEQPTKGRRG